MPSSWRSRWACTPTTRSATSANCMTPCSAPCAWWSTPACTPSAGAASRRSNTTSTTSATRKPAAITEIERYCVWPGQASSYMVGKLTWLRAARQGEEGAGPEVRHPQVPRRGPAGRLMPLTVLDTGDRQLHRRSSLGPRPRSARRAFLGSAAAFGALAAWPRAAFAQAGGDATLAALLERFFQEGLDDSPERATSARPRQGRARTA